MQLKIKTFFFKYVNEINTRSTRLIQSNALYILTGRHNIPEDFFFLQNTASMYGIFFMYLYFEHVTQL